MEIHFFSFFFKKTGDADYSNKKIRPPFCKIFCQPSFGIFPQKLPPGLNSAQRQKVAFIGRSWKNGISEAHTFHNFPGHIPARPEAANSCSGKIMEIIIAEKSENRLTPGEKIAIMSIY